MENVQWQKLKKKGWTNIEQCSRLVVFRLLFPCDVISDNCRLVLSEILKYPIGNGRPMPSNAVTLLCLVFMSVCAHSELKSWPIALKQYPTLQIMVRCKCNASGMDAMRATFITITSSWCGHVIMKFCTWWDETESSLRKCRAKYMNGMSMQKIS